MSASTQELQKLLNEKSQYTTQDFNKITGELAHSPGIDLRVRDQNGWTLIDYLIFTNTNHENDAAIENLLRIDKALLNYRDQNDNIPLQTLLLSSQEVSDNYILQLIDWGSYIQNRNIRGESLLHTCCASGKLEAAKILHEKGLDIQARTNYGDTLLHLAVHSQNEKLWEWLIESGIDTNALNNKRQTALDLADSSNNTKMYYWLLKNTVKKISDYYSENKTGSAIITQYNSYKEDKKEPGCSLSATSMQVLGGFMIALGAAVVAIALTLLANPIILGVVAGVGIALFGLGFFAAGTLKKCYSMPAEESEVQNRL